MPLAPCMPRRPCWFACFWHIPPSASYSTTLSVRAPGSGALSARTGSSALSPSGQSQNGSNNAATNNPFGSRAVGGPLRAMPNVSLSANSGNAAPGTSAGNLLRGTERFLRENRRPGSFVGTDSSDGGEFVGAQQASAQEAELPAAADTVPRQTLESATASASLNRAVRVYEPRLVAGFPLAAFTPEYLRRI